MKRVALAVMIAMVLLPGVALAGSSTDAALGLGAFAVFNQILSGTGVFGAFHPAAPVVAAPVVVQRPVVVQQPVVVAAPVYVPAPPVYVAPPPPVYVTPAYPVYVAPAPVVVAPRPVVVYPGHRHFVYERARFGHEWYRH